jgi:hypothetical protein
MRIWIAFAAALSSVACGRSSLPLTPCLLEVQPRSIDFGIVFLGDETTKNVTLKNDGQRACVLSGLSIRADTGTGTGTGFSLPKDLPLAIEVMPKKTATIAVTFKADDRAQPATISGAFVMRSNDLVHEGVEVPLTVQVEGRCTLAAGPSPLDFGHVRLQARSMRMIEARNSGSNPCQIASVALANGSDSEFVLAPGTPATFTLSPNDALPITVIFAPTDSGSPRHRTGTLVLETSDPQSPSVVIPLMGDIDVGCDLTISPMRWDFGNVVLNTSVNGAITVGNDGSDPCMVTGIGLDPMTDPEFSIAQAQPRAFVVNPGAMQMIAFGFTASDSAPPHLKMGALIFQTGNARAPNATVPLTAFINTACVEASQWIYTVDDVGRLARFDPMNLTFTDIGMLDCPTASTPNSMAVDQNAVAWVAFQDGELFKVDVTNAGCQATTFRPNQDGILVFGMGFVFDPMSGIDTLFIAGGQQAQRSATLATITFPSLAVNPIGDVNLGIPELTGTGDGELWGFSPANGSGSQIASLVRIDPTSAQVLETHEFLGLPPGMNWALKFWGGSFWIFLGQQVHQVMRSTPDVFTTVIPNAGRTIVGAGVSTCAPLHMMR